MDNAFIERLWRSMRHERIYLHAFETGSDLRSGLAKRIGSYNTDPSHSGLDGRTPGETYRMIEATPLAGQAPATARSEQAA